MNLDEINNALEEATTPRRHTIYQGPTNMNGKPDTTSIADSVGIAVYRYNPLYAQYTRSMD